MNNYPETTEKVIQHLLNEIPDTSKDLREKLQKAVADLELHKSYGLRFERHIPEVIDVDGETVGLDTPYYPTLEHKDSVGAKHKNTEHTLMECDNYVGLKYLQYTHQNKVDVIYIDPPYNTGNKDWKYNDKFVDGNDSFRHSKWLSFIEKRLKSCKSLIKNTGAIFISIDQNEVSSLNLLTQQLYPTFQTQLITVVNNLKGRSDTKGFATCNEYLIAILGPKCELKGFPLSNEELKEYKYKDELGIYKTIGLKKSGKNSLATDRPNMHYPIFFCEKTKKLSLTKDKENYIEILPIIKGKKGCWRWGKDTFNKKQKNQCIVKKQKNDYVIYEKMRAEIEGEKRTKKPKTVWINPKYDTGKGGKNTSIFNVKFNSPKPPEFIKDILYISTKKTSVILDFFAGSGTTLQAVAELNSEDGGNRQCILMTNNEGNICEEVTWPRVSRVLKGYKEYKGHENQSATYYKMGVIPEDKIEFSSLSKNDIQHFKDFHTKGD